MIVVVIVFFAIRYKQKMPAFSGQPIVRKGAASADKEVLVEFKGGDADPRNWYFVVRRQHADGTWGEDLTILYRDYVSTK